MMEPTTDDPTGLCLRMIANKRRLLPKIPLGQEGQGRQHDEPSYRSLLSDVVGREYRDVYLHPDLLSQITRAIDGVINDHLTDIVIKETVDACVSSAIQDTLSSQEVVGYHFQW